MASTHIRRGILAALMESPFYFNIPLRERMEFLNSFSQQYVHHRSVNMKKDQPMNIKNPIAPVAGSL